ncbi:MAG: Holliday junction branch migration protein RuvA [Candidatus Kerfeldbacteria bacterium]|nr:Holliday junction branch migration protein RuvA [Candidatus Kerfeldbacteria bacterium]
MIASLHGKIQARDSRALVIDVNGVGYRVYVGAALLGRADGETVDLFTHLHLSGDTIELYGFATIDELGLFLSLIKVAGVGPKSALAILSGTPAAQLRQAIIDGDPAPLTRASGIGKKTAERIILELSGTLVQRLAPAEDEVLDALERLGYTRREAADALQHVDRGVEDVRDRLRAALKALNKKP